MKKTAIALAVLLALAMSYVAYAEKSDYAGRAIILGGSDSANSETADDSDTADSGKVDTKSTVEIINGDFEMLSGDSGIPTGWAFESFTESKTYMEVVEDEDGGNCLHIVCGTENDARAVQNVEVEPNTYYRISCRIRAKDIQNGKGVNISAIGIVSATSEGVFVADEWQELELVGRTGESQRKIKLGLRIGGYDEISSGEAWFDDVNIEQLDEIPDDYVDFFIETKAGNSNTISENNTNLDTEDETAIPYLAEIITTLVLTALVALLIYTLVFRKKKELTFTKQGDTKLAIIFVLAAALLVRVMCNFLFKSIPGYYGHSTDIRCFMAWGYRVWSNGPSAFYGEEYFADYPPGYMWVLGLCESLRLSLNVEYGSAAHSLIMKLPSIVCDLAVTYMAYKVAIDTGRTRRSSILIACLVAFNPVVVFISSVWGQIDIVLSIFLALTFIVLAKGIEKDNIKRLVLAGLFYGIAVALKPQALMVGPLFAMGYIVFFIDSLKKGNGIQAALATALAALCAFAIIIIPALPFTGSQEGLWLIDKYAGTATSYNYATIEAYNIYALLGANWKNADTAFLFGAVTYKQFGTVLMVIVIAFTIWIYAKAAKKREKLISSGAEDRGIHGTILICAAYLLAGLFTLGHFMHERYLFPALILVLFAMLYYNDVRLFAVYAGFSVSMLCNVMGAFLIIDYYPPRETSYKVYMAVGAVITILTFIYFTYVILRLTIGKDDKDKYLMFLRQKS